MDTKRFAAWMIGAICLLAGSHQAFGQLQLTQAAINQGLTLTTFTTGFPVSAQIGVIQAFPLPNGTIMTSEGPGTVRILPDNNGQTIAAELSSNAYTAHTSIAFAQLGNNFYMADQVDSQVQLVNSQGVLIRNVAVGVTNATDIVADPLNGLLYVSENAGNAIVTVNPITGGVSPFVTATIPDQMYITPDASTMYVNANGHILGFNIATKAQIYDSGEIGVAAGIFPGSGPEQGDLLANLVGGSLVSVNLTSDVETTLAAGGQRGEYLTIDPKDGSLFVTQTTEIMRLTGATSVPEPTSISILLGIAGLAMRRPRHRRGAMVAA